MDILGKEGEQASKHVREVAERVEELESHLDAVDSALQDFTDNYSRIMEEELEWHEDQIMRVREILDVSEDEKDRIEKLENRVESLEGSLNGLEDNINAVLESDIEDDLKEFTKQVKQTRGYMKDTRDRIQKIEDKVDKLEGEMIVELKNREFDFENKIDQKEFEEKEELLMTQIRKLKTSVVFLADELDKKNEIEVD